MSLAPSWWKQSRNDKRMRNETIMRIFIKDLHIKKFVLDIYYIEDIN
jgi:hypothetical protein